MNRTKAIVALAATLMSIRNKEQNNMMKPKLTAVDPRGTSLAVSPLSPIRHRALTILVGGLLTTSTVLALTPSARADFSFSHPVRNQKDESFCIGIDGGFEFSGAEARLFKCVGGGSEEFRFFGGISEARIVNNKSKLCLRIKNDSTNLGAQVVQGSCTSQSAKWRLTNLREGSTSRLASITNKHTGMCIGVSGGQIFHDAKIQVFGCGNTAFGNGNWVVNPNRSLMPF
jgi:hypothetical protein